MNAIFAFCVIFAVGAAHILLAVLGKSPRRITTDLLIDAAGAAFLGGICVTGAAESYLLITALFIQVIVASCYIPRILKYKEDTCLYHEFFKFSSVIFCGTILLLVATIFFSG